MPTRNYKPEQMVTILRQMEVQMANGKTAPQACQEAEMHTQTYSRWRKEYGGLKREPAKRLQELEKGNARRKRLVAQLSLEKQVLQEVAEGNFSALSGGACTGATRVIGTACRPAAGARARDTTV